MKLILLILGVAVIALNLFLWYSKRQAGKTKADGIAARSIELLNDPEVAPLKQSAAAELGLSIEQLDRLSVEEIEELASERGLI